MTSTARSLGNASSTAVVCIECQQGVIGPTSVLPGLGDAARDAIPAMVQLLAGARAAGIPVVHATYAGPLGGSGAGTAPLWKALAPVTDSWTEESEEVRVLPELLDPRDLVLPRHHGLNPAWGTELLPVLRGLGVRTIVLVGVSLNVALPLVSGEAVHQGFEVIIAREAVVGTPADYGLQVLRHTLGMLATITTVAELTGAWESVGG